MTYDAPRFSLPLLTPAVKHLLIANAVVFAANMLLTGRLSEPAASGASGFWFAFSWDGAWEGYGLGWLRLFTYQFTHSFHDAWHFVGNMLVLYFMGTIAEPRLGYLGAWKLYLAGGVCGALLHLGIASIQGFANVPLVGASGACYAFLVYAALRWPQALVFNCLPLWLVAAILVFVAAYQTFVEFAGSYGTGVAHTAHLGGAALAFAAFKRSWFIDWADHASVIRPGIWTGMVQRLRARTAARRQHRAVEQQLQLDEILGKVKRDGLQSLSSPERRFLERMSRQAQKRD